MGKFEESNGNPSKFWDTVSTLIPDVKSTKLGGVYSKHNSFVSGIDAANEVISYFVNVGSELNQKLPNCNSNTSLFEAVPFVIDQINEISIQAIEIKLERIEVHKSSGIAKINSRLLKIALLNQKERFCKLINLCISTCIFSLLWKISTVIPIPKKGDTRVISNLRPIALLPIPGKILEKCLEIHLSHYLEKHNILSDSQGGFRRNHSTQLSTFKLTEIISSAINDNKFALVTYLDVSKAFDMINHTILLNKLVSLGIVENFFSILHNYLEDRQQCTNYNGHI